MSPIGGMMRMSEITPQKSDPIVRPQKRASPYMPSTMPISWSSPKSRSTTSRVPKTL